MKNFNDDYKKQGCYWGLEPSKYIKLLLDFKNNGNVLDLGVGEGRNALFLANSGFNVTGIDTSKEGIDKFKELAKKNNLKINAILSDIMDFEFNDSYDIIISNATLHFLKKELIDVLINRMKNFTNKEGINFITAFSEENPNKNFAYLFKKDELKDYYRDWEILKYKEFITPLEQHSDGEPHKHGVVVIIARKIK